MSQPQDNLERIQFLEAKVEQLNQELPEKEVELEEARTEILNQKQSQIYEISYKRMAHDIKNKIGVISSSQKNALVDLKRIKNFLDCYIGLFKLIERLKSREISRSIET